MLELKNYTESYAPIYGEYDVVVVGGGMAGVGAAVAAGRNGAKTILIENTSALGGLATMGLVNIPLDFLSGLGQEMFARLKEIDGLMARNTDPEKHKLVFDRMVKDAGCDLLLVTPLVDTIVDGDTVKGIIVHTKEGRRAIMGKRFVDASGDSDLVYFAGGEVEVGREKDNMSMGCSLEFVLGGVDMDTYMSSDIRLKDVKWIKLLDKATSEGRLPDIDNHINWMTHIPGRPKHCGMDEVSICFAHSRNCFPTKNEDLTRMYMEGREQVNILAKFIKENIPGFENSYLSYTGSLLGVRESRRIVGEYRLTGMDIATATHFDDVIAISYHGFDLHGFEESGNMKWFEGVLPSGEKAYISNISGWGSQLPPDDGVKRMNMRELLDDPAKPYFYDIPYRALVHKRLENVLAAGRNLSSDVPGQSGTRLVMCCMSMGEAAGTACAISLKDNVTVRNVDVKKVQQAILDNGGNLYDPTKTDVQHSKGYNGSESKDLEALKAKGK